MRYFIGYTFSEAENARIEPLRKTLAARFGVQAAIKIPPHITVLQPFEVADSIQPLQDALTKIFSTLPPTTIRVTRFSSFDQGVWFLDVEQAIQMKDLKRLLAETAYRLYQTKSDHPIESTHFHLTLAYKDVTPEAFQQIGAYLQTQPLPLEMLRIETVTLFIDEEGPWKPVTTYRLGV